MFKIKNSACAILCALCVIVLSGCGGGGGGVETVEVEVEIPLPDFGTFQTGAGGGEIRDELYPYRLEVADDLTEGFRVSIGSPLGHQAIYIAERRIINGRAGVDFRTEFPDRVYFSEWFSRDELDRSSPCNAVDCWNSFSGWLNTRESFAVPNSGTATYLLHGRGLYDPPGETIGLSELPVMGGMLTADFAANSLTGQLTDEQTGGWRISLTKSDGVRFARGSDGRDFSGTAQITQTPAAGADFLNQTLTLTGGFAGGDDWIFGDGANTAGTFDYAFVGRQR